MIADLRGGGGSMELRFGDAAGEQRYLAEVARIRKGMTVRFQVAPGCAVTTPSGKVINAGCEVRASDLHGGSELAWRLLQDLVLSLRVIEADAVAEHDEHEVG